jgi:hypothetical protein
MDTDRFWSIIESSRRGLSSARPEGNMEQQVAKLGDLLAGLSPTEIIEFWNQFNQQFDRAYRWDLWGAAYIIADGCSDDGFTDFRSWLISMGRQVFEKTLSDVESLADVADAPGVEDVFFEDFRYVPAHVYEELTGLELPAYPSPSPSEPEGEAWDENGDDLERRFPRLWAKYQRG